jgi:hypothetical protein
VCPHCGHSNLCPDETTGTASLVSSRLSAPAERAPHHGHHASTRPSSPSIVRIAIAVLLLTSLGWAGLKVLVQAPAPTDGRASEAPLSAADERQREILEQAIGHASDPALVRVYDEINGRHFGGRLPAIPVAWEPRLAEVGPLAAQAFTLEGMFGHIGDRSIILLHPELARDPGRLRRALSHEMVHAWLHTTGDSSTGHGPAFQNTLRRLSDEGAFDGVVATPQERESLRVWLEGETMRLDTLGAETRRESEALAIEARELEQDLARLNARPRDRIGSADPLAVDWTRRRDAHNRRVEELNRRTERVRSESAEFNAQVERYNLMLSYPDGLDGQDLFVNRQ